MRTMLSTMSVLLVLSVILSACSVDTDNEAEASVTYFGQCDQIDFTDSLDVSFGPFIEKLIATEDVPLTGDYSVFVEEAKTDDGYVQNAIYKCHAQAVKTYDNILSNVTSAYLRRQLQTVYGDSVEVDSLNNFTIRFSLHALLDNGSLALIANYSKNY